jgi:catechol 2,3-dioxygenase-like lactoylglutathione lyase family enzyme
MRGLLDHTIVPSRDVDQSASFYVRILGFTDEGLNRESGLRALRVTESLLLFFEESGDADSPWAKGIHHLAFYFDKEEFSEVFQRLKASGIPYGHNYDQPADFKGPGIAPGARGNGKSVYFKDPSGNLLQIITY